MAFLLNGKRTLITGATAGIGLAVAKRFVAQGAEVVICGRRAEGHAIGEAIGAHFVQTDLTEAEAIKQLFLYARQHLGGLDVVINNACLAIAGKPITEQSVEQLDQLFDLNIRAAYQVMQQAAQCLGSGGVIINTASIAAAHGAAGGSAYYASKAALVSLTKTAALELAEQNIRVNAVSPGLIESEIWGGQTPDNLAEKIVPMKRVGSADEAAAVYQFLASDDASYITGANYLVDGGYSAGPVKGNGL